ncbi:MAG: winged helix-turn-helix domain-containing protein [Anaerolineae bacterium]|nr:winged helix-turn-helix domain-containing protein [Anaerolineae bacterium]
MTANSEQAFLMVEEGELTGTRIAINGPAITIGRSGMSDLSDVTFPERQISRQHAEIVWQNGCHHVRDLDSKNGTYLNGHPVHDAVPLQDNDIISLALCVRLRYIGADATLPLEEIRLSKELRLDPESRRVWIGVRELTPPLSPAQYQLLELLYNDLGRVYSRDEVVESVWGEDEKIGVTEQAIDALVRRLRERLAEVEPDAQYIVTVRGYGFRLDPSGGGN